MAMNSTNVPGMDAGMYQRQNANTPNGGGTVVPGMHEEAPGVETSYQEKTTAPVVGFLYSISRRGVGEFWPVCIGQNIIGRAPESDITLGEATVSSKHAILNVKKLKSTKKIVAQIVDAGSKNGLMVNGDELDFGMRELKNEDVIQIGDHYKLLLLLIDAEDKGLSVSEDFISTDEIPPVPTPGFADFNQTNSPYSGANRAANGTQAMDGRNDFAGGGTKFL